MYLVVNDMLSKETRRPDFVMSCTYGAHLPQFLGQSEGLMATGGCKVGQGLKEFIVKSCIDYKD